MANAGEPLFVDFIEEEGGGGVGTNGGNGGHWWEALVQDGKYYRGWQILLGGGRCEEQKKVGVGEWELQRRSSLLQRRSSSR